MKTALVTGATDGIGLATAMQLAQRAFRVLVHGRTQAKAEAACRSIVAEDREARVDPVWGDFAQLSQVRALAAQSRQLARALDVLVNNAGVFAGARTETPDGLELTFQVNHLAPFALTLELRGALEAAGPARVVNVSSMAHANGRVDLNDLQSTRRYDGYSAYSYSKLLNVHFTHELARRLAGTQVTTSALHPGVISTKLLRAGFNMTGASVQSGAATSVFCATDAGVGTTTGRYYSNSREVPCAPHAVNERLEGELWARSEALLAR